MKIQLKRSNVTEANGVAKEPTASQMEYGELAVNYNTDDPAIFIKTNDNSIIRIAGVGNIADDGQVEVPSSIAPPSDPLAGNLWFNPVDGRLYVYYDDDNSQQWVDASPDSWNPSVIPDPDGGDNQPGTLDDRYVKQIGDNMTGNLTLGTDIITLNAADGDITAEGVISSGDFGSAAGKEGAYIWKGNGTSGSQVSLYSNNINAGAIYVASSPDDLTTKTTKFTVLNSGELRIGNNVSNAGPVGNVNIRLYNDGNADFNGQITYGLTGYLADGDLGTLLTGTADTTYGTVIGTKPGVSYSAGRDLVITLNRSLNSAREVARFTGEDGNLLIGGTLPASPKISLNADGSAAFIGPVDYYRSNGVLYSRISAYDSPDLVYTVNNGRSNVEGSHIWRGSRSGGAITEFMNLSPIGALKIGGTLPASPNISLNADGTAVFNNTITGGPNSTSGNSVCFQNAQGYGALSNQQSSGAFILGYGVKGATVRDDFLSTSSALNSFRVAYTQSGALTNAIKNGHSFWSTDSSDNSAIDQPVDMKKKFHVSGQSGDVYIGSDLQSVGDENILLRASDGDAQFAGTVNIGPGNPYLGTVDGVQLHQAGYIATSRTNPAASVYLVYNTGNSTPTINFLTSGRSIFAADASINGVTVGQGPGTPVTNTVLGVSALLSNTTGAYNTAVGLQALSKNTTGQQNTAVGRYALINNTEGVYNTAVGVNALQTNTTGNYNTAVGRSVLSLNQTGSYNTAIGREALSNNTTGDNNTAVGYNALIYNTEGQQNTAVGQSTLFNNLTGNHNTAVGRSALSSNTTGSGNICLGSLSSGGTYAPVFNVTTQSNRIVMGTTNVTNAYVQVAWTVTSDARDKTNFAPVPYGLDFVKQLQPTAYQFKAGSRGLRDLETNELIPVTAADELPSGPVRYGFKAQDILALEGDNPVIIDNEDPDHLKYRGEALVPVLVNAIKEQQVLIDALTARLDAAGA